MTLEEALRDFEIDFISKREGSNIVTYPMKTVLTNYDSFKNKTGKIRVDQRDGNRISPDMRGTYFILD